MNCSGTSYNEDTSLLRVQMSTYINSALKNSKVSENMGRNTLNADQFR